MHIHTAEGELLCEVLAESDSNDSVRRLNSWRNPAEWEGEGQV